MPRRRHIDTKVPILITVAYGCYQNFELSGESPLEFGKLCEVQCELYSYYSFLDLLALDGR